MVMNITGYRFVELPDRDALKIALREECLRLGLKGLILLAPEGMNYFLAGSKQATDGFRHYLDGPSGAAGTLLGGRFANIPCKESLSSKAPFRSIRAVIIHIRWHLYAPTLVLHLGHRI